ncbi:hypothetical protein U3A58_19915 [Algoriphagus sp. C2-6-M1]|nr:hypothetical protein [Algoriphagus sp. C2-6-M1]MEB2782665.1 hypothetical protein [Algoriphagus sp. C2-6-M1]
MKPGLEWLHILYPKDFAHRFDRKQELTFVFGCLPLSFLSQSASRYDAVKMYVRGSCCPQVWRMAIIPDLAPRCFGSLAKHAIVFQDASNRLSRLLWADTLQVGSTPIMH